MLDSRKCYKIFANVLPEILKLALKKNLLVDLKTFIIKAERADTQDEQEEEIIIPDDTETISNIKIENEYVCDREIKIENDTLQDSDILMKLLRPETNLTTISNGPPFICNICGHSLRTINSLHEHHILKHSPVANQYDRLYVCNNCGHNLPSSKMAQRTQRLRKFRDEITIFACNRCGIGKFEYEKRTEHDKSTLKPNTCEYCLMELKNATNYREHVIHIHNVNPFQCKLCTRTFKSTSSFKSHIQTKHENKRYICEQPDCGKMYSTLDALRQHNYKHMNTMPYRCDICQKMCSREGILRRHLQRDHDIQPSQHDLDDMLVGKLVNINAELKTVNKFKKRHTH